MPLLVFPAGSLPQFCLFIITYLWNIQCVRLMLPSPLPCSHGLPSSSSLAVGLSLSGSPLGLSPICVLGLIGHTSQWPPGSKLGGLTPQLNANVPGLQALLRGSSAHPCNMPGMKGRAARSWGPRDCHCWLWGCIHFPACKGRIA